MKKLNTKKWVAIIASLMLVLGLAGFAVLGGNKSTDAEGMTAETTDYQSHNIAESDDPARADASVVYMTTDISPAGLMKVYEALGVELTGDNIAVKVSTGEPPASNYLDPDLIRDLVARVNGTIVECNTAYGGSRSETAMHYQVAEDHGFTTLGKGFLIMDEDGESMILQVEGGQRLSENYVGAHFGDFDGFLVLSHFKGHQIAGFGGAIKNISIGIGSQEGKNLIHTAGRSHTSWFGGEQNAFLESMADAGKSVVDALDGNILFINVMNHLSIDCDCNGYPSAPDIHDIGILASTDPVALDQACVDLIYEAEGNASFIRRMENQNAEHVLEAGEQIGLGSREYSLVSVDDAETTSTPTATPTQTPTAAPTPTATPTPTASPSPTAAPTPTETPDNTTAPVETPTPTLSPLPTPSEAPTPTVSPTASSTPTPGQTPVPDETPTPIPTGGMPGDIDGDGHLTVADSLLIARCAMEIMECPDVSIADYDGNGNVEVSDALLVMRTAMGLVPEPTEQPGETPDAESTPTAAPAEGRTLVVYFSATNNTETVAGYIADAIGADMFELIPVEPYTSEDLDWTDPNSRVSREHDDESLRDVELVQAVPDNWDEYDTVFIGYPIWWGSAAWPVDTFIKANDFTGKTVIPFCTSASSGLGQSAELLEEEAGSGSWLEGHRFRSNASEDEVRAWVESLGL